MIVLGVYEMIGGRFSTIVEKSHGWIAFMRVEKDTTSRDTPIEVYPKQRHIHDK